MFYICFCFFVFCLFLPGGGAFSLCARSRVDGACMCEELSSVIVCARVGLYANISYIVIFQA